MLRYTSDEIRKYQLEQKQIALEAAEKIVVPVANLILDQIREQIAANPDIEIIYYDIERDKIFYEEGMGSMIELIDMKYEPQLTKCLEEAGFEVTCTRSKYSVSWFIKPQCR